MLNGSIKMDKGNKESVQICKIKIVNTHVKTWKVKPQQQQRQQQ